MIWVGWILWHLRKRARIKAQIGFFARWKIMRINIQPPEDIVYIKRRFAALLGSCTDIADHTNGHIFARVGFKEKNQKIHFRFSYLWIAACSTCYNFCRLTCSNFTFLSNFIKIMLLDSHFMQIRFLYSDTFAFIQKIFFINYNRLDWLFKS